MSEQKNMKPKYEKLAQGLMCVIAIVVIGSAVLALTGIWEAAEEVTMPLLSIQLLLQAYLHWNQRRKLAVFSVCAGVPGLLLFLIDLFV